MPNWFVKTPDGVRLIVPGTICDHKGKDFFQGKGMSLLSVKQAPADTQRLDALDKTIAKHHENTDSLSADLKDFQDKTVLRFDALESSCITRFSYLESRPPNKLICDCGTENLRNAFKGLLGEFVSLQRLVLKEDEQPQQDMPPIVEFKGLSASRAFYISFGVCTLFLASFAAVLYFF